MNNKFIIKSYNYDHLIETFPPKYFRKTHRKYMPNNNSVNPIDTKPKKGDEYYKNNNLIVSSRGNKNKNDDNYF